MTDDIEVGDELDTTSGAPSDQESDQLEDGHDDGGDAGGEDAPTENKWNARRSLSELLEDDDAEKAKATPAARSSRKPAPPTGDAEGDEGDEELDDDEEELDDDEDLDEEEDAPKRGAKQGQEAGDQKGASGKPRYTIKGADGKTFAFELEKGASIQFKGDGRDIEVKSVDELVQLAQKGAAFDRKTSEQGKTIAELTTARDETRQLLSQVRKTAEQTLMAALFDREARQKLRAALKPYRDPQVRQAAEVLEREAEQQKETQRSEEQIAEGKRQEFWQGVGAEIRTQLEHFEHLTNDDALEIATRFHAGYSRAYDAKFAELTKGGTPEEQANRLANEAAVAELSDRNLRRVMRGLNAELAEERRGRKGKAARTPTDPTAARQAAEAHNPTTHRKLEQRGRTPRLQGGGGAPGGTSRSQAPAKPRTFAQRMDSAIGMLRNPDAD